MNSEINEQYLNGVYENLQRCQMSLLAEMKTGTTDLGKDKDIQKQLTLLNTLLISILRFRNLKKQILERNNL
jgi:hypothetical protein